MADKHTDALFEEPGLQPRSKPASNALVIRPGAGQSLTKDQRSFNRLTKRIAELERKIAAERIKLDSLLSRYHELVGPLEQALARRRIELARALSAANDRLALRKRQKEIVRAMILHLCDEAFCFEKPDADAEALYDEWSETSYREEHRQQVEERRKALAEELRSRFDVEAEAFGDDDSAEAMARLLQRLEEEARAADATQPGGRRGSSKRREREAQLEQREVLTRKSVRDIYLSLAKVLHPDAVPDPAERSLREDCMKKAALAYRNGDIAALLKLQLRWVTRGDAGMRALSDETLGVYLPALREQVEQLERALRSLVFDPRYFSIGPVAAMTMRDALFRLGQRAKLLRLDAADLGRDLDFVKRCTSNSALVAFASDYLEAMGPDRDLEQLLRRMSGS